MNRLIQYLNDKQSELESMRNDIQDEIESAALDDQLELLYEIQNKVSDLNESPGS